MSKAKKIVTETGSESAVEKATAYAEKCEANHGNSHPKTLDAWKYVEQLKEIENANG